jgi:hypothetical protein
MKTSPSEKSTMLLVPFMATTATRGMLESGRAVFNMGTQRQRSDRPRGGRGTKEWG